MNIKRIIQSIGLVGLLAGCDVNPKAANAPKREDYNSPYVGIRLSPEHREYNFFIWDVDGDRIADQIVGDAGETAIVENHPRKENFPHAVTMTPRMRAIASELMGLRDELSYELGKAAYEAKKGE